MDKKTLTTLSGWVLVLGGLLLGYEGLAGADLIESLFGSLKPIINIAVFGLAAIYMGYQMLGKKK